MNEQDTPEKDGVFQKKRFRAGQILICEGALTRHWFILESGRVGVFKQNVKIEEFSSPGTLFGELSAILNQPRTATLKALEPCEVVVVDADIDQLVLEHPEVTKKLVAMLAQRLARTTEYLWSVMSDPPIPKLGD